MIAMPQVANISGSHTVGIRRPFTNEAPQAGSTKSLPRA